MFTVGVSNKAGLEEIVYSDPVIIDTTSPEAIGTMSCPSFVQVGKTCVNGHSKRPLKTATQK